MNEKVACNLGLRGDLSSSCMKWEFIRGFKKTYVTFYNSAQKIILFWTIQDSRIQGKHCKNKPIASSSNCFT